MNALEQRLAETERALFVALCELHDDAAPQAGCQGQPSYQAMRESVLSSDAPTTQQEKAELVSSWARRPLENRTQTRAWLESMRTAAYSTDDLHQQPAVYGAFGSTAAPAMVPVSRTLLETQSQSRRIGTTASNGHMPPARPQRGSSRALRRKSQRPRRGASHPPEAGCSHEDGGAVVDPTTHAEQSRASIFAKAHTKMYF